MLNKFLITGYKCVHGAIINIYIVLLMLVIFYKAL